MILSDSDCVLVCAFGWGYSSLIDGGIAAIASLCEEASPWADSGEKISCRIAVYQA